MISRLASLPDIPIESMVGLRPKAWLCVGSGFSREDIKAELLNQGVGFVGEAITSLDDIARRIVSYHRMNAGEGAGISKEHVIGPLARQEILRQLLAERKIAALANGFQELKKLRRQTGFFRKLDFAIQAGRMAFAHAEEERVYLERLEQRLGSSFQRSVRAEVQVLALGYETWLQAKSLWDLPLLYSEASRVLNEEGWPQGLVRPESVYLLSNQNPESRERDFCDSLKSHVELVRTGFSEVKVSETLEDRSIERKIKRWHSWDDAAEGLADAILEEVGESGDFSGHVILISDQVQVRRTLNRVLSERGIPQADPRDPTRVRWDEGIKWAMLPFEVLGRDFERAKVVAWLRAYLYGPDFQAWVNEINSRGVRQGLKSYEGGLLASVHAFLKELETELGGKKTAAELADAHLGILRRAIGVDPERMWILSFFEQIWKSYTKDIQILEREGQRAPLRFWLERLQARIQETPSPVEPLKAVGGIAVFRLQQAPCVPPKKIWILGLPPDWLAGQGAGDYWFSEREREILGAEFPVRSGIQVRAERLSAFHKWMSQAQNVALFDALYDPDGRERESLATLFRELSPAFAETPVEECGAHPRWLKSYGALRPIPPQELQLSRMPVRMGAEKPEISATMIDRYSRCSFQGLAYHRWKLRDLRDPDTELWPEVRGNILHQAVKHLLTSRDGDGQFTLSVEDALERAWKEIPPKGLLRSQRVERYVRSRMLKVLHVFCEKERDYFSRARAKIVSLDDQRLSLDYPEFRIVGTPDRIDMTDDGLFIIDYKTSSSLPNGTDMLELGYRLQLPFYALAASQQMNKPVAGVQFIELTTKGGRGAGMFFKKYNGKEAGKFTQVTARSKSLLSLEPDEAWSRMEEQIVLQAQSIISGKVSAKPRVKPEKECIGCQLGDLCGFRRNIVEPSEE
jgi:RecB family exonuclease